MSGLEESSALVLARHLFVPRERWGWQYVDPGAPRASPDLDKEPQWLEPPPPDLQGIHARQAHLRSKAPKRAAISGAFLLAGLAIGVDGLPFDIIALILGVVWFLPLYNAYERARSVRTQHQRHRQGQWNQFNQAHEQWDSTVKRWDASEQTRRDGADLRYPLEPWSPAQRVDVFGGTPDGWSALLCTAGTTILESGTPMFVIDLTEEDVTGPLCTVARLRGFPMRSQKIPARLEAARLLEGLSAEEVAELIAESVDTMRRGGEDVELRMLDVELIQSVVTRFDDAVTFGRIEAGLLALQQGYDIDRDKRLTAKEFQRITDVVDTVAATERARNEIQFLRGVLDMLPSAPPLGGEPMAVDEGQHRGLWPDAGVSVLRTEDDNRRRRDFVDRLMAQVLLQRVRHVRKEKAGFVLVLAGADHLGHPTLELLARRCRQAGIRLVLMMEHLRGELQQLLGGADSVTLIMRLGNAQEAGAAAEHIGRGHSFLLTQLTRQSGQTKTTGTSQTTGTSKSENVGKSRSRGDSWNGGSGGRTTSKQRTKSSGLTTGESTQWGTNDSDAVSTTDGQTVSRVYEFTVEPTQIQSLDMTSFLFVESSGGQRRVVAGNCDPYMVLMPKVSRTPVGAQGHPTLVPHRQIVLDAQGTVPGYQTGQPTFAQVGPYGAADPHAQQPAPWQQPEYRPPTR